MPNWVYNTLSASGTAEEITAFEAEMKKPHPHFVPHETDKWGHKDGVFRMTETEEFSFWNAVAPTDLEHYFTGENWYNWNISNWGTKWDVTAEDVELTINDDGTGDWTCRLETAWSPPIEAFRAIAEKYPTLALSLVYEEEQGWGGEVCSDGDGGIFQMEEYDIPESHADYAARNQEGVCMCAGSDDEDDWFEDCPRDTTEKFIADLTTVVA